MQTNNQISMKITANILGGVDYFISKQAYLLVSDGICSRPISWFIPYSGVFLATIGDEPCLHITSI